MSHPWPEAWRTGSRRGLKAADGAVTPRALHTMASVPVPSGVASGQMTASALVR